MGRPAKYSLEDCRIWANKHNGQCLAQFYTCRKMQWQCERGHIWKTTPSQVKKGHWCPCCAGNAKLTIEEMHKIARKKGGECLSNQYINSDTKLQWQCREKHTWWSQPSNIKLGRWCPVCKGYINEEKCRFILESLTQKKFYSTRSALGNGWELDGFCRELNLAFEYQGIHHYKRVKKWYTEDEFEKLQQRDKDKSELCEQKGINKLNIPYYKAADNKSLIQFITDWLEEINVHIIGKVNWNNFITSPRKLENIQKMAARRNAKCLSKSYSQRMKFQCQKCEHVWESRVDHIKDGHGCPKCAGRPAYTIEDMRRIAVEKNGLCLSDSYINEIVKLTWQCQCGNIWKAKPHNIKLGKWCPKCGKKKSWETRRHNQELAKQ